MGPVGERRSGPCAFKMLKYMDKHGLRHKELNAKPAENGSTNVKKPINKSLLGIVAIMKGSVCFPQTQLIFSLPYSDYELHTFHYCGALLVFLPFSEIPHGCFPSTRT